MASNDGKELAQSQVNGAIAAMQTYVNLANRSLDTLDTAKVETDPDVQMLLAHLQALTRGGLRLARELQGAEDEIEGLRKRLREGTV